MTALFLIMVLSVTLKSLIFLLASRSFSVRSAQDLAESRFLAEAGLAKVQQKLTEQANWIGGFDHESIPGSNGTFTVHFASGSPGALDSVNNMLSSVAANGPRGAGTVPPYTSDVTVVGRCHGKSYQLEALVSRRLEDTAAVAIAGTGRIFMKGNVNVSGIRALDSGDELPTGIHSNSLAPGTSVSWTGAPGEKLEITGDLTASSTDANAILLTGIHAQRDIKTAQPPVEFPRVDIKERVKNNNSHPPASFTPLATSNLGAGQFYQSTDTTVSGDIVLHDTTLYIQGDLNVNGSISGTGSVFVTGKTTLRGDSHVKTSNAEGVALYSHDSVALLGFDGGAYMRQFCLDNPQAGIYLTQIQSELDRVRALGHPLELDDNFRHVFHQVRLALGYEDGEDDKKLMKKLRNEIADNPIQGPTSEWVIKKLNNLKMFFDDAADVGGDDGARASFLNDQMPRGFAEVLSDGGSVNRAFYNSHREEIWHLMDELNFDKMGTSYFQGVIQTHGSFYAANEVTILGSISAQGDSALGTSVQNGQVLGPGDIFVENGVVLKFSKEYALTQGGPEAGALPAMLRVWIPR
ncbi:hypothetical protein JST97_38400 [bacterium]|nr:hypothetical protein [bacterium]